MILDIDLLRALASRAHHLQRAKDPEARMALNLFQDATTPQNVLELLEKIENLESLLGTVAGLLTPSNATARHQEAVKQAKALADSQRKKLAALELENRELNERSRASTTTTETLQPEVEASAERTDWKLVPVSFVEDALCAVDLIFSVRHQLQNHELTHEDTENLLSAYARQLEEDGYVWSSQVARYPEHPLLALEPPHLLDEEIVRDAQSWREHLYLGVEVVDVQTNAQGKVRYMLVANRTTWEQQRLVPDVPANVSLS
jgi:hypothetical protein